MLAHPDRRRRLRHRSVLPVHRHQMGPGQLRRPHPTIHHRRLATTRRYPRLNSYGGDLWVAHLTWTRKREGTAAWWESVGHCEGVDGAAAPGPCDMAKTRLLEMCILRHTTPGAE